LQASTSGEWLIILTKNKGRQKSCVLLSEKVRLSGELLNYLWIIALG